MSHIVFVDLETTGLDPTKHGIVEIAAIYTIDGEPLGTQGVLVNPGSVEFTEEAEAINGFDAYKAANGLPLAEAIRTFDEPVKSHSIMAGWNVGFDYGFLRAAYELCNRKWPFSYHMLDIQSVFRFMNLCGRYKGPVSLERAAGQCGVIRTYEKAHKATSDVIWTHRLFQWAQERMRL